MNVLYFNYLSVSYLAGSISSLGLFIYLLSLKNKTSPTWLLCLYFLFTILLCFGYFTRASILDPVTARYSNYIIGLYTSFSNTVLLAFAFSFPRNLHPRESRIALPLVSILGALSYGLYVYTTSHSEMQYEFNTQLYQFKEKKYAGLMALVLVLTFIYIFVLFFRKINLYRKERLDDLAKNGQSNGSTSSFFKELIKPERKEIRALRSFAFAIILHLIFSLSYIIYLSGYINFFNFQLILTSATSIQLFLYTVIYLNNAPQPTSFSVKLVGISLVSIILIMGLLSKITLGYNDNAYQNTVLGDLRHAYDAIPGNKETLHFDTATSYIAQLNPENMKFNEVIYESASNPDNIQAGEIFYVDNQEIRDPAKLPLIGQSSQLQGPMPYQRLSALDDPQSFYTSYLFKKNEKLFEIGFSYLTYRERSHSASVLLILIMLAAVFSLIIILPFFFYGSLIAPLNRLLAGVKEVNKGDYQVHVPVQVRDEIGFLSNSFNTMVASIREAHTKLEDYAENLENKVKHRTAELNNSLTEIKALKQQQDGDYFLTSLLIAPLSQNLAESNNIHIESLTKQKKKFKFRKWEAEIGGDLCISRTLELQGRKYIVFLNADAMGKSIQGAGGALVIGAVFEALLKRTLSSAQVKSQPPERWLKNAFVELHNVFISFNGTMLISVALGLIDDSSGFLFYLNAEHPHLSLYRDGQASFIEPDYYHMKLGHSLPAGGVNIDTFQLKQGDVLLVGSDGRDDLRMFNDDGTDFIQEDETLFLRCIEEGHGHLDTIYESIKSKGQLTDDLTLMRIGFREDFPDLDSQLTPDQKKLLQTSKIEFRSGNYNQSLRLIQSILAEAPQNATTHKLHINNLLKLRNHEQVIEATLEYFQLFPGDPECLFILARAYRHTGEFEKSLEYSERLRLRQPQHIRNLIILAENHMKLGNSKRSLQICSEILDLEPENQKAQYMQSQQLSV